MFFFCYPFVKFRLIWYWYSIELLKSFVMEKFDKVQCVFQYMSNFWKIYCSNFAINTKNIIKKYWNQILLTVLTVYLVPIYPQDLQECAILILLGFWDKSDCLFVCRQLRTTMHSGSFRSLASSFRQLKIAASNLNRKFYAKIVSCPHCYCSPVQYSLLWRIE